MTDATFEGRLGSLLTAYAEAGVRPIDPALIATATIETGRPRSLRRRWSGLTTGRMHLTPRLLLLAAIALLAIALAVVVVGRQATLPPKLADRPAPTAQQDPTSPPPSPPRESPAPSSAPSAGRIAYIQAGDVYVAASDGSAPVKVLDDPGIDFTNVRWLSDGRHAVVDSAGLSTIIDLTTGDRHRLDIPRDAIAVWRSGSDEAAAIRGAAAAQPAQIVIVDALTGAHREIPADPWLYGLAWSADGSRLGGVDANENEGRSDLVWIDPETGSSTFVATVPGAISQVAWSTDVRRIAYVVDAAQACDPVADKTCPTGADVYTVDATADASATPTKIAGPLPQIKPDGDNHSTSLGPPPTPAWSSDGSWVAYRTAIGLGLVRPDGTGKRKLPVGHVAAFTWDADGSGITAILTETIDGTTGDTVHIDLATGSVKASGPAGISLVSPTSVGPTIDHAWETVSAPSGSEPAPAPTASPSTTPPPPTSHRLLATTWRDCGGRAAEIDLDTGVDRKIGSCGVMVAADGRHLVDDHAAIDLLTGTSVPVRGRHLPSPSGRWLITPPSDGDYRKTAGTTWEVASWDGTVRARIPRPWGSPTNGPWSPSWSEDDATVTVRTEHDAIRVDLTTGEQTVLPDPGIEWWRLTDDGRPIVFTRDGDAWIASGDGSDPRNISNFPYGGAEDAWLLRDEQTVAVLQGQVMWILAPDGGRRAIALGAIKKPYDSRGISWSPDGGWFASTVRNESDDRVLSRTRFFSIDGELLGDVQGGDVAWSPDGQHAAVSVNPWDLKPTHTTAPRPLPPGRLTLVGADGRTKKVAKAWGAVWSPDSTRMVVFSARKAGAPTHLDVLDSDGTGRHTVSTKPIGNVTWIPDR